MSAREPQVGDRVRVTRCCNKPGQACENIRGPEGTLDMVDSAETWRYRVKFDAGGAAWVNAVELINPEPVNPFKVGDRVRFKAGAGSERVVRAVADAWVWSATRDVYVGEVHHFGQLEPVPSTETLTITLEKAHADWLANCPYQTLAPFEAVAAAIREARKQ